MLFSLTTYSVTCDGPKCLGREHTEHRDTAHRELLQELERRGWRVARLEDDGRTFCPECVKELDRRRDDAA